MKYRMRFLVNADVEFLDSTLPEQIRHIAIQKIHLCLDKNRGIDVKHVGVLSEWKRKEE